MKSMLNFFVQSQNVTAFRYSYLQKLAESFGAKCKNFTPDSCDMIFPNKKAFEELIEGNYWHDTYWGVCEGVGENHLGKLLMEIRNELYIGKYGSNTN